MPRSRISLLSRLDTVSTRFLINALDKADPRGLHHALCVAEVGYALAKRLKHDRFGPNEQWLAGLLHDIGHLGIPRAISEKRGKLTARERQYVQQHPKLGKFLCDRLFETPETSRAVLCHHERPDGKGYPAGLTGEAIPFMARVIAVVDAYDTMRSASWLLNFRSHDDALEELRNGAGSQFDPDVVRTFLKHENAVLVTYEAARKLKAEEILRSI